MTASPADAVARVLEVLDRLEIPYLAGGSAASSVHGISRPTLDLDIVADLRADQMDELVRYCSPIFTPSRSNALWLRRRTLFCVNSNGIEPGVKLPSGSGTIFAAS